MPVQFCKFHGYGNDYIVIEADHLEGISDLGEFTRRICNRHYGAGADGIAVIGPAENDEADFRVRIFNPDGSEAGLSGNGTRCAAAFLHFQGGWTENVLRLITRSGVKRYFLRQRLGLGSFSFESELGQPRFDSASIPMLTPLAKEHVINYPLEVAGSILPVTAVQVGNPNCCIFVVNFDQLDWRHLGPLIENHKQFPERTNVIFVRVIDRATVELRIWERGVGHTTASGTCSCAAVVAAIINGRVDRRATAKMEGGQVEIQWRDDDEIVLTGSAAFIYCGVWP